MKSFFLLVAVLTAGAIWAFPGTVWVTGTDTDEYVPAGTTEDGSTAHLTDDGKGVVIDGESGWGHGTVTRFETPDHNQRLEELRRLNAPTNPDAQVTREAPAHLDVTIDRKIHDERQRRARKGFTTPLP